MIIKITAVLASMLTAAGGAGVGGGETVQRAASTGHSTAPNLSKGASMCRVGSHGSLHVGSGEDSKVVPQIILACGARPGVGRYEIVGFNTTSGFCFRVDVIQPGNSGGGVCKPTLVPWSTFTSELKINGFNAVEGRAGGRSYSYTEFDGEVPQAAKRVVVQLRHQARLGKRVQATVAAISGKVMKRLGQPEPFKLFAGVLPGCVPSSDMRIVAETASGRVLGAVRGSQVRNYDC